jgi:hypothetical protein
MEVKVQSQKAGQTLIAETFSKTTENFGLGIRRK